MGKAWAVDKLRNLLERLNGLFHVNRPNFAMFTLQKFQLTAKIRLLLDITRKTNGTDRRNTSTSGH
jgi:hypothetical protein